jgi:peptide/nickel transport system permease protein
VTPDDAPAVASYEKGRGGETSTYAARPNPFLGFRLICGLSMLGLVFLAALIPLVVTVDPWTLDPRARLKPPDAAHWFGTDRLGRDVFARTLHGAQLSLLVGVLVSSLTIAIGTSFGMIAGFWRGLDRLIVFFSDAIQSFPIILLAISLAFLAGPGLVTVLLALVFPSIPQVLRVVRGVVQSVRAEPYVEAARAQATPPFLLLVRHILPNTYSVLAVMGTYIAGAAITSEAALSFLGVGMSPETVTWGNMIAEGRRVFQIAPWIIFFPCLGLGFAVLGMSLVGDQLRDALDPKHHWRV